MFSKASSTAGGGKDRVPSIISASLRIVGDLVSDGDVQVDGVIEGDVSARTLTVSQGAAVHGQITAESVCIRGEVQGQITADKVELGRTARVSGDVVHADLAIESGAFLEGHCRHRERAAAKESGGGREGTAGGGQPASGSGKPADEPPAKAAAAG